MIVGLVPHFKGYKLKYIKRYFKNHCKFEFQKIQDNNFTDVNFLLQNGMKSIKLSEERRSSFDKIENSNLPILIREEPVLRMLPNKTHWHRLSWNSFFMDEGLHPYDKTQNRWGKISKSYNISLENYKRRGDHILINLQQKKDAALNKLNFGGIGYHAYIENLINDILKTTDRKILLRPHPIDLGTKKHLYKLYENNKQILFSENKSLYDDLDLSWCMITYNSTSCVESIIYGTHTICLDSSAVGYEVSGKSINDIENSLECNRTTWLNKISYMQFHMEEFNNDQYIWNLLKDCNLDLN